MPRNKKKTLLICVSCVLAVALILGGVFTVLKLRQPPVYVYAVSDLSTTNADFGGSTTSGYVKSDKVQNIFLTETQTVTQIHVTEGQQVKAGDPLLDYDTTLTDLQLQRKELEIQKMQRDLAAAKKEYNDLCGYNYYSLADQESLVRLSAGLSKAGLSWLDEEDPVFSTDDASTDTEAPTAEPTEEPSTEPTQEPTQPSENPSEDGVVKTYVLVGGQGTEEKPYLCVFADGIPIEDKFINSLLASSDPANVVFVQCEENRLDGVVTLAWGMKFESSPTDGYTFTLFDASDYVGSTLNGASPETPVDPGFDPGGGGGGYSYAELQKLKAEKAAQIKELDVNIRLAQVEYDKMKAEIEDGTVYAEFDGVVSTLSDPDTAYQMNEPVLKLSGGGGFYIEGTISELALDTIHVGDVLSVTSWTDYCQYEATVESVSDYPSSSYGWSDGNTNVSYYPFTVFVDDSANLQEGEYVDISLNSTQSGSSNFYLEKPFVLQENGRSYVYVAGEDGKLEKRALSTGGELWGSYVEVLGGISMDDYIAFPYGKAVKDGAKTEASTLDTLYNY